MKSRALRMTLLTLFVGSLVGAGYVVWSEESQASLAAVTARGYDDRLRGVARALLDIKSAQAGYVAAGQGDDFWVARVAQLLAPLPESLATLRSQAHAVLAQKEVESAISTFEDFEQMDRRAREYARDGQRLLASDLVFTDGIEKIDTALAALDRARHFELAASDAAVRQHRRAEALAVAGTGALGLVIMFALVPVPGASSSGIVQTSDKTSGLERAGKEAETAASTMTLRRTVVPQAPPTPEPQLTVPPLVKPPPPAPPPPAPPAPLVDLQGIAALCTELARVIDTRALPSALERAAAVLDASGIVIWIADPDGRELAPVLAHGYPENLVTRFGTIARDAENVTAAAYRTGLIQTVKSDRVSNGAVAAPLLTPNGPVGVMSAEMRHDGEQRDSTLAVAAIVAAQLATLVGPPIPRAVAKTETAGA